MEDAEFLNNIKGGVLANIATGIMFIILWVLKNKCKHSKCKVQNRCFTCSIKEDDSVSHEGGQRCPEKQCPERNLEQIKISV